MNFQDLIKDCPCITILRGVEPQEINAIADAIFDGGIKLLEITLNSPVGPLDSIAKAVEHTQGRMMIGAGTVLTVSDVRNVHAAGGKFIISPNTDSDVIHETVKLGMISIPGFFTATEAFTAIKAGADYLKLFPAGIVGPGYVKDLKAVVSKPIIAVGGVNAANLPAFMQVCAGVGIGSAVYKKGRTPDEIRQAARLLVQSFKPVC
ncbi:MAG: 2-dehydro-3-deoxy-6-phosphogalactonate aldolase [Victivallales bacterium]|nr:2-dehydro-3-deoxy-6-phosphogalactonate aldolase [Victivallales bacterium]